MSDRSIPTRQKPRISMDPKAPMPSRKSQSQHSVGRGNYSHPPKNAQKQNSASQGNPVNPPRKSQSQHSVGRGNYSHPPKNFLIPVRATQVEKHQTQVPDIKPCEEKHESRSDQKDKARAKLMKTFHENWYEIKRAFLVMEENPDTYEPTAYMSEMFGILNEMLSATVEFPVPLDVRDEVCLSSSVGQFISQLVSHPEDEDASLRLHRRKPCRMVEPSDSDLSELLANLNLQEAPRVRRDAPYTEINPWYENKTAEVLQQIGMNVIAATIVVEYIVCSEFSTAFLNGGRIANWMLREEYQLGMGLGPHGTGMLLPLECDVRYRQTLVYRDVEGHRRSIPLNVGIHAVGEISDEVEFPQPDPINEPYKTNPNETFKRKHWDFFQRGTIDRRLEIFEQPNSARGYVLPLHYNPLVNLPKKEKLRRKDLEEIASDFGISRGQIGNATKKQRIQFVPAGTVVPKRARVVQKPVEVVQKPVEVVQKPVEVVQKPVEVLMSSEEKIAIRIAQRHTAAPETILDTIDIGPDHKLMPAVGDRDSTEVKHCGYTFQTVLPDGKITTKKNCNEHMPGYWCQGCVQSVINKRLPACRQDPSQVDKIKMFEAVASQTHSYEGDCPRYTSHYIESSKTNIQVFFAKHVDNPNQLERLNSLLLTPAYSFAK